MACCFFLGSRLPFPLLTSLVFTAIAAAAACGDDEASPTDASDGGGLIDSFLVDTSAETTITPAVSTRLTFVNAAHDLGAQASFGGSNSTVRLCFSTASMFGAAAIGALVPAPDFVMEGSATGLPGVDQGRGVTLPDFGLSAGQHALYPIVISSRVIASTGLIDPTCDQLLRGDSNFMLQEDIDYWTLPVLAPFTLQPKHAYILALTGCSGNATTVNPGKCGPGFTFGKGDGIGNLALHVFEPLTLAGAQFLHLSSAANAFFAASNERSRIEPGLDIAQAGLNDGGTSPTFVPIAGIDPPLYTVSPVTTTSLTDKAVVELGRSRFSPGRLSSFLSDVAVASGRTDLPYTTGGSYVFVAVGDPDVGETPSETQVPVDGGGNTFSANSRAFHFLGFPSQ